MVALIVEKELGFEEYFWHLSVGQRRQTRGTARHSQNFR